MSKLSSKFPNFVIAMQNSIQGTDTIMVMNDGKNISYIMSLIILKNKVANITIELDSIPMGVVLSFCTMKGIVEKAKTSSHAISRDLPVEEWQNIISDLMAQHHYSPNHTEFLNSVSRNMILKNQKSGCMLFFAFLLFSGITCWLI